MRIQPRATLFMVGVIVGMILTATVIFGVWAYTLIYMPSPEATPLIVPQPGYWF